MYCAILWAMKGCEWSTQAKGVFAKNRIDSCTKAS